MNLIKPILGIFLCFVCIHSSVAQIATVKEVFKGKTTIIESDSEKIIEINSNLEVFLSKEKLLQGIKEQFPQLSKPVDLSQKINKYEQALINQRVILDIMQKQVTSLTDRQDFYRLMINFLNQVKADSILRARYNMLSAEYFSLKEDNPNLVKNVFIFSNLNRDLADFKNDLKDAELAKYSISLLAFKKDKQGGDRVHVRNFDTYTEREHYSVERWVVDLSDDQKQKLKDLAELAKENNAKSISIFEELKEKFKLHFASLDCFKEQKDKLIAFVTDGTVSANISAAIKSDITTLTSKIDAVLVNFKTFNTDVGSWDIMEPFSIREKFQSLITSIKEVELSFKDVNALILAIQNIEDQASTLAAESVACFTQLTKEINAIKSVIDLLLDQQENYILNKEIGEEVIPFTFDNLPSVGYINLKGTGKRANGDELQLEVVLRIPSKEKGLPEQVLVLEQQNYIMQLVGARSETTVGMILANPNNDYTNENSDRKFFFAPSAALLLKFGSRNSTFYNEFIDVGIGLNFASPDFDTDGTPEFGMGLIATVFKDIISVGYNYNVSQDDFYWFFGINLPFNLPGLPVNPIKN